MSALLVLMVLFTTTTTTAFAANPSLIDPNQKGSITIHKFNNTGSNAGSSHDGTELSDTSGLGSPLGGISFTITTLPYTVTDDPTIAMALQYMQDNAGNLTQQTLVTNGNGIAAFVGLDLGIYLVQEGSNTGVSSPIAPFLVKVPMTNPQDNQSWLYDIHVYPKNTVLDNTISKDVIDENGDPASQISADVGDTVKWNITPSIPLDIASIDLGSTGYFFITDDLDSRLDFVNVDVILVDATGTTVHTFQDGVDYTLTAPQATSSGGQVKVDFNKAAGITTLEDALTKSYTINIIISTTINETALVDLSKAIANSASLYYKNEDGDPSNPEPPITPENPDPEIDVNGIAIYKWTQLNATTQVELPGAEFTIYASQTDAENDDPLMLNGNRWTLVSDSNGYLYFPSKDIESILGQLQGSESFYVVETKAPAGYELVNNIIQIPLGTTADVENIKLNGDFTLPITGGTGTLLFTIVGLGLIAVAIIVFVVSKRKENESDKF